MKRLSFILILIVCPVLMPAQTPSVEVTQYHEKAEIGDQVDVYIKFRQPENLVVNWPDVKAGIKGLELLSLSGIDTARQDKQLVLTQALKVTAWDSGRYQIPAFSFNYYEKGDTARKTITSTAGFIRFSRTPVDTTKAIAPIQEPLKVPYIFAEFLPYITVGIGVIILIIVIILLLRYFRKPKEKTIKKLPPVPAHVWALEKLKELENLKLWQNGATKEYYISLTDIFRHYVERRYGIRAMESTTGELLSNLQAQRVATQLLEQVERMLREADMVKFAKAKPPETDHTQNLRIAYDFVEETKKRPEPLLNHEATPMIREMAGTETKNETR